LAHRRYEEGLEGDFSGEVKSEMTLGTSQVKTMRTETMRTAGSATISVLFAMLFASISWAQANVKDRMVERRAIEAAVDRQLSGHA
jgi:hypothetical protein